MLKNHFKTAWRTLLKNKWYSALNIGGLAIGIAVVMSIGLWVYDELTFDRHIKNHDRIAAVMQHSEIDGGIESWSSQSYQVGLELRNNFGSYFKHVVMSTFTQGYILSFNNKAFTKSGNFMEAAAPQLLSLTMLKGSQEGLKNPSSILLSETAAKTLFGDVNPIGKVLNIDNKMPVNVTGVYQDLPRNTSFNELDFIAPLDLFVKNYPRNIGWINNWLEVFVELDDKADMSAASEAIKLAKLKHHTNFNSRLFLHLCLNGICILILKMELT